MRILIVESDASEAPRISNALRRESYAADIAPTGAEALRMAANGGYDLILLDLARPADQGLVILEELRRRMKTVPILIFTATEHFEERVMGLDQGADGYMIKPIRLDELFAWVRVLSPSRRIQRTPLLAVQNLEMNIVERWVRRGNRRIHLSPKEFALLECLMRNAGSPVDRGVLLKHVFGLPADNRTNVLDVYIYALRRKVDLGFTPKLIWRVRRVGYGLDIRHRGKVTLSGDEPPGGVQKDQSAT